MNWCVCVCVCACSCGLACAVSCFVWSRKTDSGLVQLWPGAWLGLTLRVGSVPCRIRSLRMPACFTARCCAACFFPVSHHTLSPALLNTRQQAQPQLWRPLHHVRTHRPCMPTTGAPEIAPGLSTNTQHGRGNAGNCNSSLPRSFLKPRCPVPPLPLQLQNRTPLDSEHST